MQSRPRSILFVCLGNICRSPLAEGILKAKAAIHRLPWTIDSAGTGSWHVGSKPDSRSIAAAASRGIDIRSIRGRQITEADLERFDHVLVMDSQNYQDVKSLARPEHHHKIGLVMNFAVPGRNINVPDPYWNDDGFDQVYDMLDEACEAIIRDLAPDFHS